MRYLPLIWSGLWRRRTRTGLTLLSAIVAFFLFGMLQGVDSSIQQLVNVAHIDRLISGNPALLPLPIAYLSQVEKIPGVKSVTHADATVGTYRTPTSRIFVYAIDAEKYFSIYPETVATPRDRGAMQRNLVGALASLSAARKFGWHRGDRITFHDPAMPRLGGSVDWPVEIVGFCDYTTSPDTPILLINYSYLDAARLAGKGTIQRLVTLVGDPAQAGAVSNAIDALFANAPVPVRTQTEKDFAEAQLSQIGDVGFFVDTIIGAVFFTLLLLVGNSLMQSFRERTREFAILKTLGFSDLRVAAIVLSEALLLCGIAGAVGLAMARAGLPLLGRATGGLLPAHLPLSVLTIGLLLALVAGFISGAIPAIRSSRLAIVDALTSH
jgi:putative ABC transport system permease protein